MKTPVWTRLLPTIIMAALCLGTIHYSALAQKSPVTTPPATEVKPPTETEPKFLGAVRTSTQKPPVAAEIKSAPQQHSFEGVVTFKKGAASSKLSSTVAMYIKGDKFLADEKGDKIQQKIIVDATKKMIYMVMDKEKMIMDLQMEKMVTKGPEAKLPTKSTKTQKIAGYDCEQWIDKTFNGEVELWTNGEMGKIYIPEGQMGDGLIPSASMRKLLKQGNYFPLLLVERDKTGREITRLEVLSIEKKALEDALFTTPSGYQRMSMPGTGK